VLDALFADSVPTGARSSIYTTQFICSILSQALGPAIAALLFYLHGNTWDIEVRWAGAAGCQKAAAGRGRCQPSHRSPFLQVLQRVMLVGMAMALIPAAMLFFFDDSKALGTESEGLLQAARQGQGQGQAGQQQHSGSSSSRHRSSSRRKSKSRRNADDLQRPLLEGMVVEEAQQQQQDGGQQAEQQQQQQQQQPGEMQGVQPQQVKEDQPDVLQGLLISAMAGQQDLQASTSSSNSSGESSAGAAAQHGQQQGQQQPREDQPLRQAGRWGWLDASWIPAIMASSDIIIGLASGMTIKFFPM
jgi:hypothetical protein